MQRDEAIAAFINFEDRANVRTRQIQSFTDYPNCTKTWIRDLKEDWPNQVIWRSTENGIVGYDSGATQDALEIIKTKVRLAMLHEWMQRNEDAAEALGFAAIRYD